MHVISLLSVSFQKALSKHVDKFAARGMVKENQREGAKAEAEWEMHRAQRRELEKDMPKGNVA